MIQKTLLFCLYFVFGTVGRQLQKTVSEFFLQVDTMIMIFYGFNKQKIRLMEQIAI